MGKFEEQLLSDLMREHGPELATAQRPTRRTTKPGWIAAGAVALAGAATGAVLLWPTQAPASAVTKNNDGTVTVSVNNLSSADDINKELRDKRVPMRVDLKTLIECGGRSSTIVIPAEKLREPKPLSEVLAEGVSGEYKLEQGAGGELTLVPGCDTRSTPGK
nr:hypothetical protein [Kibdelosporangium sp. MJ126-NF4]CEL17102.1 hypothetical protein [Kibdelosporangium sp. MJ126-NF4]CTQ91669.1 hypothetical protein [Kibdelosporangium sp. MJ126-NF4]